MFTYLLTYDKDSWAGSPRSVLIEQMLFSRTVSWVSLRTDGLKCRETNITSICFNCTTLC